MGEGIATEPKTRRRRIIERPRLTRLLDGSQGRIKMLVAPAGYGKTTLARQWLVDKQAVWYTATPASADVAALAAGLKDGYVRAWSASFRVLEMLSLSVFPSQVELVRKRACWRACSLRISPAGLLMPGW